MVGAVLREALKEYVRDAHLAERDLLAAQFQQPGAAIDYDRFAEAFAVSYLLPNYWKMAHAMHRAAPRDRTDIVDLGSGPGTAAWAALAWLASQPQPPRSIALHLVDRSERCLSLAGELSHHVLRSLPTLRTTIDIKQADLSGALQLPPDSLILLSHVLTEHPNNLDPLLSSVLLGRLQADVLIVEREDDDVWATIDRATKAGPWLRADSELHVDWHVETLLPEAGRKDRSLRTRWMLLTLPSSSPVARAAIGYFDAWRRQDVSRICEIFAADATYVHDPFERPLRGRDEIVRYWREEVLTQHNPRIEFHMLAAEDTRAIVEWTVRFERAGLDVTVSGVVILRIDPRREQIVELREYYHSAKIPMSQSDP